MNVIFLTLANIGDIQGRGIYVDLIRKFRDEGHQIYVVSPCERRLHLETSLTDCFNVKILQVKTLNLQKSNIVEKGIGTLLLESQYKRAIRKYLSGIRFDLILYSTPPITIYGVVRHLKLMCPQAISYLLLKDIFPQNAVDIGYFGEKSLFYWYFRRMEVGLYKISDYIGCMSPANVVYLKKHNPYYPKSRVEVAPNSIEMIDDNSFCDIDKREIRLKYGLPTDKPIFIYGGNLGKPQGIEFLIKCLDANKTRKDCFFLVVGNGTDYSKLSFWYENNVHKNVMLLSYLPKADYQLLVKSCDVGLIFLDHRFTIPNYPSRLLSYLECRMPVICATDINTDVGSIAEKNGYGFWCESVKVEDFSALVDKMLASDIKDMGERGYNYLKENYSVLNTYSIIVSHIS